MLELDDEGQSGSFLPLRFYVSYAQQTFGGGLTYATMLTGKVMITTFDWVGRHYDGDISGSAKSRCACVYSKLKNNP